MHLLRELEKVDVHKLFGGVAEDRVSVCVPHDQRRGPDDCINDGQEYDVGGTGELP